MSSQNFKTQILKFAPLWAFLAYGTWSTVINYISAAENYWLSGFAQGIYAFITTLALRYLVLKLFSSLNTFLHPKLITYTISLLLMILVPAVIHHLIGTKEIFYSILPGAVIGAMYLSIMLKYEVNL